MRMRGWRAVYLLAPPVGTCVLARGAELGGVGCLEAVVRGTKLQAGAVRGVSGDGDGGSDGDSASRR